MDYKEARIFRAKHERIFLMRAERINQNEWSFTVQGQSGKNYLITATRQKIACRCMDCALRRRTCKHLLFIVAKIARSEKLLNSMTTELRLGDKQYDQLDMALMQRLQKRIASGKPKKQKQEQSQQKEEEQIDLGDDLDCPICFDEMKGEELSRCLLGCKKYFHKLCMDTWLQKNQNCPLCRSEWSQENDEEENQDNEQLKNIKYGGKAMSKLNLKQIKINQNRDLEEDDEQDDEDIY